jgi:hypothetical protein
MLVGTAMTNRPSMTLAVKRLIRDAARRIPELSHIRSIHILVVAGEARRSSRATIQPAHFGETRGRASTSRRKPLILVKGRKILYVITLRPLWFVESTPEQRINTILHELYHVSTRFDGTLHRGRRHSALPQAKYDRRIRQIRDDYLAQAPKDVLAPFAYVGEVRVRMWLEKPRSSFQIGRYSGRRVYTEGQLFCGLMPMRSVRASTRGRTPPAERQDHEGGGR